MELKIDFKKNPVDVEYDSRREINKDEIAEYCSCNEREVPAEGSDDYYDIVKVMREIDREDFEENCAHLDLGYCLVHGYAGLWDGHHAGGKVMKIDDANDLLFAVSKCDDCKVYIDKDGLHLEGYHHDGTNHYIVEQLTKKGAAYYEHHNENPRDYEVHKHLQETKGYLKKIKTYLF